MPTKTASSSSSKTAMTTAEVRRQFIDYFAKRHGHTFAPSSPVVPHNDPTLMFTNAGMNQFKDVFLGQGNREYVRAVNTQKCIRAGGKHNDLEDVGRDTYHHTFFEMLGNWSFGDYFKAEAIEWAWDLLTNVWGLDPSRLYVTVFAGDKSENLEPDIEAENIWKKYVPAERISRWAKKDNFWEMGDTGPCGPCSEIHYDNTPDGTGGHLVNKGDPRVIEIWNLVFIQYNRAEGGKLSPLPAKHVDTGMGLERVARVLQQKDSNYDIDVFTPIFEAITKHTGARPYGGDSKPVVRASRPHIESAAAHGRDARATDDAASENDPIDIAYRVIADHIRCLTVAITDGARPSNDGRGYVLRRILRRAVRHAHQTLNTRGAWMHKLVPTVVKTLGEAFPELSKNPQHVADVIMNEEESFLSTLEDGLKTWWSFAGGALTHEFATLQDGKPEDQIEYMSIGGPADHRSVFEFYKNTKLPPFRPESMVNIRRGLSLDEDHLLNSFRLGDINPELLRKIFPEPPAISAQGAFRLHDTYGFPIDLTRVMAEERGMTVDLIGYEALMEEARAASRKGADKSEKFTLSPDAIAKLKHLNIQPTDDSLKYENKPITATVKAIWNGNDFDEHVPLNPRVALILDRTCFYAESGGQVGDVGEITAIYDAGQIPARGMTGERPTGGGRFRVEETHSVGGYVLHIGRLISEEISVGDRVTIDVENAHRNPTMANHTATHLLNLALRQTLGEGVDQKGSLVAPDKLRFDFSHHQALAPHQLEQVQLFVNERILEALPVNARLAPLNEANEICGLRAVFGEKYPDPVRVVSIGPPVEELLADPNNNKWMDYSIEFCGGTHLAGTQDAQRFVILSEQALASGVRRIVALTGVAAMAANVAGAELTDRAEAASSLAEEVFLGEVDEISRLMDDLTLGIVTRHHLQAVLAPLREQAKDIRKRAQNAGRSVVVQRARELAEQHDERILVASIEAGDRDVLLSALDVVRQRRPDSAVMLLTADPAGEKVFLAARVPDELIQKGLKAGDWVKQAAQACGGSGGGKPDVAQAGGKDPGKIDDAVEAARDYAEQKIS